MKPYEVVVLALAIVVAGVLFAYGCYILACAARVWSEAAASGHKARAHGATADSEIATTRQALDALEEADETVRERAPGWTPPSMDELIAAQKAARPRANGRVGPPPAAADVDPGIFDSVAAEMGVSDPPSDYENGLYQKP